MNCTLGYQRHTVCPDRPPFTVIDAASTSVLNAYNYGPPRLPWMDLFADSTVGPLSSVPRWVVRQAILSRPVGARSAANTSTRVKKGAGRPSAIENVWGDAVGENGQNCS